MTDVIERLQSAIADRYRVERELGQGGMATVFLARDLRHEREVALKVLRPELAAVIGGERFLQEIRVTANLQHSHILPLYDSGAAGGFLYYVMPYVEGETLRGRLDREKQLGVEQAVEMTRKLASALEHAHRQGVIHRDIKPENILLRDGDPVIADFGIALAVSHAGGNRLTETGLSLGTPFYMSPEQAMGDRELDARSDVYSLAAVLYEMLVGDPPYQGSTAQAIIAKVITERATAVTVLRDTVPDHVSTAIQKGLAKLPADRFASAAAFADALAGKGYGTPAVATTMTAAAPRRRDPRVAGLVAALVLALAGAAWGWLRRPEPPRPARFRIALTPNPVRPGMVGEQLAISPDGSAIVFSDTAGGVRRLYVKAADRAEAEPLTGTDGGSAPAFSPDGAWIAFIVDDKVRKVPVGGGSAVTVGDSASSVSGSIPQSIAWLDNGTIAYTDRAFGLTVVGQDGGPKRRFDFLSTAGMGVVTVGALPGGSAVMLGMCNWGCPSSILMTADLRTGKLDTLAAGGIRAWHLADGRVVFARLDGGVFAAPFSLRRRRFASDPVPVLDGVRTGGYSADIAISPAGTLVYVPGPAVGGSSVSEVVWVTRDGRATLVDSGWTFVPSTNGGIRLSPDGRRLALAIQSSGTEEIWVKQLDHGPFVRLSLEGASVRPEWSADGRYIFYFGSADAAHSDLRRRRADGTGTVDVLAHPTRALWEVQPTRDSTKLVVRLGIPKTRDIYLLDRTRGTGDSAITPLVASDQYEETSIGLSPDGRYLAYTSNESGRMEVYVRSFPDVNAGRWQVSGEGGMEPRWSRDGRELFYRRGDGAFVSVAVPAGRPFDPGAQRVLFPAGGFVSKPADPDYDITPDGRRFVVARYVAVPGADRAGNTVVLVQHWLAGRDAPAGRR